MGIYINKFLDRIKAMETRPQRELVMSLSEARDLHTDITKLLLALHELREQNNVGSATKTDVSVDGGTF